MVETRRFKYGIFLHPALPDPQAAAVRYTDELVASFTDPLNPELGRVAVRWQFPILRVDDSVVFDVKHEPGSLHLFRDDGSGPVRSGLLEVLDWWNSETLLIAPATQGLAWDVHALPNAWSSPWGDGLQVQTITQYPNRLGKRVLAEWNPGLLYLPFEVNYTPPTREQEVEAMDRWTVQVQEKVRHVLAESTPMASGPWFLARAQRYLSALAPLPTGLRAVGSREAAEAAAQEYRGPCFLIDQSTGETLPRWDER